MIATGDLEVGGMTVGVSGERGVARGVCVGGVTSAICVWVGVGNSDGIIAHRRAITRMPVRARGIKRFMVVFLSGWLKDCHSAASQPGLDT